MQHNVPVHDVMDDVKTVDDDVDDPDDAGNAAAEHQLHDVPRQHGVLQGQGQETPGGSGKCPVGCP